MDTNTHARTWRISLSDGRTVQAHARKVVVTDSGALMVLAGGNEPRHIFNHWTECAEEQSAKPGRIGGGP